MHMIRVWSQVTTRPARCGYPVQHAGFVLLSGAVEVAGPTRCFGSDNNSWLLPGLQVGRLVFAWVAWDERCVLVQAEAR